MTRKNSKLLNLILFLPAFIFSYGFASAASEALEFKPVYFSGTDPDTLKPRKDNPITSPAITDTSWSGAAGTMSKKPVEIKINPVKKDTTGKGKPVKAPPKFVDPFRPPELLDGLKKAQNGDLQGAIVDFTAAIKKNPRNYNAYFYRAKAKIETGDSKGAMEDINLAIENRGDEAIYFYYRGKLYSDEGISGKALIDFDKAIRLNPGFTDALNFRGVERAKLNLHKEALLDYDSAIATNPKYPITYYNKGTSQAALGDYTQAITSFSKAIELDSKHVLSYLNRGNCYVQLKEYDAAIKDFGTAISMDPRNPDAYFNRGAAHFMAGDNKMCPDWRIAAGLGNAKAKSYLERYCK